MPASPPHAGGIGASDRPLASWGPPAVCIVGRLRWTRFDPLAAGHVPLISCRQACLIPLRAVYQPEEESSSKWAGASPSRGLQSRAVREGSKGKKGQK
jgi:hypothetical protein